MPQKCCREGCMVPAGYRWIKSQFRKDPERGKWASGLEWLEILQELCRRCQNRLLTASSSAGGTGQGTAKQNDQKRNFSFNGGRRFGGISLCRQVMRQRNPWRSRTAQTNISRVLDTSTVWWGIKGQGGPGGSKARRMHTSFQQLSLHVVGQICNDQSDVHGSEPCSLLPSWGDNFAIPFQAWLEARKLQDTLKPAGAKDG